MGTSKLSENPDEILGEGGGGVNHGIDWHPIQGAGVILLVTPALARSLGDVAQVQNFFLLIVSAFPFILLFPS